jgi:hypothetical protein
VAPNHFSHAAYPDTNGVQPGRDDGSRQGDKGLGKDEFSAMVDRSGLTLTEQQKSVLFAVYPMFQAMVDRATPPMPREAEPSVIFVPEVK